MDVNSLNLNINIVLHSTEASTQFIYAAEKNILLSNSTIFIPTPHSIPFCIFFKNLFWDPDSKDLILSLLCIQAEIEKMFLKK